DMLTFLGHSRRYCDGVSRRDFLKVGSLAMGGLTLADVLRLRAQAATTSETAIASGGGRSASAKSVIMIYLPGGPTHLDMYDMKPDAAVEFRGELHPIRTNVRGIEICELMPRQAKILHKLAIVRGLTFVD